MGGGVGLGVFALGEKLRRLGVRRHARSRRAADDLERLAEAPESRLRDIGATRLQIELLRSSKVAPLWPSMMGRLGVDRATIAADPALRADVQTTCGLCAAKRRCRTWLASPASAPMAYWSFCPNAPAFAALKPDAIVAKDTV